MSHDIIGLLDARCKQCEDGEDSFRIYTDEWDRLLKLLRIPIDAYFNLERNMRPHPLYPERPIMDIERLQEGDLVMIGVGARTGSNEAKRSEEAERSRTRDNATDIEPLPVERDFSDYEDDPEL